MSWVDVAVDPPPADRVSSSPAEAGLALCQRFRQGHSAAPAEVLRELGAIIRARLKRKYQRLLADDRIEQIVLEALDRAWRRHADYDPAKGPLLAWLLAIAEHGAADFCKSPQGRATLLEQALSAAELAALPDPRALDPSKSTDRTIAEEARELVRQGLAAIDDKYRDVLLAFACAPDGELTSARLAAEEGVSPSAIRKRRQRGLVLLEEQLRRLRIEELFSCHTPTVSIIEDIDSNNEVCG